MNVINDHAPVSNYHMVSEATAASTCRVNRKTKRKFERARKRAAMDWLILFTLLVAATNFPVTAEGAKKKIRIHLPQKIKHIHHHKKVYITNHPASSQYASAYVPSAEGAMAVPVVASPGHGAMDVFEEPRLPGAAASHLVPLYRARGYYGPQPSDINKDYDLPPPQDSYLPQPTGYSESNNHNKIKIVKVNSGSRKKGPIRKTRSKLRGSSTTKPQHHEDEVPVTNFHEQFYSDLNGSGTIKKIRRPNRVEKIIDGDNEHIHTYSEEHVHKLIYNDGMAGSAQSGHFRSPSNFMEYPSVGFAGLGSLGTPPQLEYMAYNPREVTHDHVFHDHGEIPANLDIGREQMLLPPRVSYNSQGQQIRGVDSKNVKKFGQKYLRNPNVQGTDYSYYENIYSPHKNRVSPKPTNPTFYAPSTANSELEGHLPGLDYRDNQNNKIPNAVGSPYFGPDKLVPEIHQQVAQEGTAPAGFGISSTVVHDYKPKAFQHIPRPVVPQTYTDPLRNFKEAINYDYDAFSGQQESFGSDITSKPHSLYKGKKGKKKSFSRQNISFGGLDQPNHVNHMNGIPFSANGISLNTQNFDQINDLLGAGSTPFTIKESSPVYSYYSAMAEKALQQDPMLVGESTNDNFHYVAPPSTTEAAVTTSSQFNYQDNETDSIPTEPVEFIEVRPMDTSLKTKKEKHISVFDLPRKKNEKTKRPVSPAHRSRFSFKQGLDTPQASGSLKYGDRI